MAHTHNSAIFALLIVVNMKSKPMLLLLLSLLLSATVPVAHSAATQPFTIVIDAGHGGKDPGALGSLVREKDVVLNVALRFGKLIEQHHPSVKIIYTRSTDVFIPLQQRATIANKSNANLFVSIHADYSENKTVKGPTCYTLGPNRSKDNFEIAKRENAVILLEDNYQQRYEGFDPNSAESYIMFEFMQDNYMTKSIELASTIQNTFKKTGRPTKGVRQDVFLVLRNTSMPSVLVELGFLTNKEEEQYLKSDSGKEELAKSLLNAFTEFKTNYERKNGVQANVPSKSENRASTPSAAKSDDDTLNGNSITYCIQMLTVPSKLAKKDTRFKGYTLDFYTEKGFYKYTLGSFPDFDSASAKRTEVLKDFPDAFVIAFKNGKRIPVNDARKQSKKTN